MSGILLGKIVSGDPRSRSLIHCISVGVESDISVMEKASFVTKAGTVYKQDGKELV